MATIESYVRPHRLYRYRSLENFEREMEAISEGYLFCSAYHQLNDPMEGRYVPSNLLKRSAKYRAIVNELADKKADTGICSFSEVRNHELMWAHYADDFHGICVSYSLSRLMRNLDDSVSFVRMYYDESAPRIGHRRAPGNELARMILSYKN